MRIALAFIAGVAGCMVILKTNPGISTPRYIIYGGVWSLLCRLAEEITR